jgi:hypothetical protein
VRNAIPSLLLVLVIQLILIAVVYWPRVANDETTAGASAVKFDPAEVTKLDIRDDLDGEAQLARVGERWLLPALHNLPADPEKVATLLDGLSSANDSWPVAHSSPARQRFQVADYLFQRRITLSFGDELLDTIYLGTSPGFRKVHARHDNSDAIRAIAFNVYDAPADDDDWVDPRLLQVRTPMRIDADAYSVNREGGEWRSGSGGIPDERELLALLTTLRSLQVQGVADEKYVRLLEDAEADLLLDIDSLSAKISLALYHQDGRHFIRSSEYPVFFRLNAYDYDRLIGIDFPSP